MKIPSILKMALCAAGFSAFALMGGAQAQIAYQALYQLGESDPGAVAGAAGNSTSIDSSGNGYNLTGGYGATYSSNTAALSDGSTLSMSFNPPNGTPPATYTLPGGYSYRSNVAPVSATNMGIEFWIDPAASQSTYGGGGYVVNYGTAFTNGMSFFLADSNILYADIGTHNYALSTLTPGQWENIAVTIDNTGTQASVYLNGVLSSTLAVSAVDVSSATNDFAVGGLSFQDFTGNLDQVALFTYAPGTFDPSDLLIGAAPEPSTMALFGLGALGLAFLVIRRRHSLV